MRLLKSLTIASTVGAWLVIVVGGYVSHTESGLGCPELIACGNVENPNQAAAAAIEGAHRIVAWAEGLFVLALLILVWRRYRPWTEVRNLTTLGFLLIAVQSSLGILAVATALNPVVVTAHLGIATAFLAVMVLNAAFVFRSAPPESTPAVQAPTGAVDS
jgi:cytochrome c oxidase assembly protein subunit 15